MAKKELKKFHLEAGELRKQLREEGLNLIVSVDHITAHMLIVEYNGNKSSKNTDLVIE